MPNPTLESSLRSLQSKFTRFYSHLLAKENLTVSQFALLITVVDEGPLPMRDLAERHQIASSSVTHLVDRLEKQGYLKRASHPQDRRSYLIQVTLRGEKAVRAIRKKTVGTMAETMKALAAHEIKSVLKCHALMESAIDRMLKKL